MREASVVGKIIEENDEKENCSRFAVSAAGSLRDACDCGSGECWGYAEKVCAMLASSRETKKYTGLKFNKTNFKNKCLGVKAGVRLTWLKTTGTTRYDPPYDPGDDDYDDAYDTEYGDWL